MAYSVREFATLKGCSEVTIRTYIKEGVIKANVFKNDNGVVTRITIDEDQASVDLPKRKSGPHKEGRHGFDDVYKIPKRKLTGPKDKLGYFNMNVYENRSSLRKYAYNMNLYCKRHPEWPYTAIDYAKFIELVGYNFN